MGDREMFLWHCEQFNWESKGYSCLWRLKGIWGGQNAGTQGSVLPVCQPINRKVYVLVAFNLSLSIVFRVFLHCGSVEYLVLKYLKLAV